MTAVPSTQTTFSYLGDKDGKQDPDYYAILNSHETSTMDQIAEEYKVLARRYHPDRSGKGREIVFAVFNIKLIRVRDPERDR